MQQKQLLSEDKLITGCIQSFFYDLEKQRTSTLRFRMNLASGKRQEDVAALAGISPRTYQKLLEPKPVNLHLSTCWKILHGLHRHFDELGKVMEPIFAYLYQNDLDDCEQAPSTFEQLLANPALAKYCNLREFLTQHQEDIEELRKS